MAICPVCKWWDRICHCRELNIFSTTRDKLFEFTDTNTFEKPINITSKSHWNKELKKRGLHDDVKQSQRTQHDYIKPPSQNYDKRTMANDMMKELHSKGYDLDKLRRASRRR